MRSLGVLCARGASKRLPRKHLRDLGGIPLVAWMCRAAATSPLDRVVLTTEDAEIAAVAKTNGVEVPFVRPKHLAADYAADFDIVVHALDYCEQQEGRRYDAVVMLQPTTPFTQADDIARCIDKLASDPGLGCCFTARRVTEPPTWMYQEDDAGRAIPLMGDAISNATAHKQLLKAVWFPSGAVYAVRTDAFRAQRKIYATPLAFSIMDSDRSVDIDEEHDLIAAAALARARGFTPTQIS